MTDQNMTREQWLNGAIAMIKMLIMSGQDSWPSIRATISATKGGKQLTRSISPEQSTDNTFEILVSIHTNDSIVILRRLVHELCHAITGDTEKHSGAFKQLANMYGLLAPLSEAESIVTVDLEIALDDILTTLGAIPHAAVKFVPASKGRNNNTMTCVCGFKANLSRLWAETIQYNCSNKGAVFCPACSAPSLTINIK